MTNGQQEPKPSWDWASRNWLQLLTIAALILAVSIVFFLVVLGGKLAFPTPAKDASLASFNLAVGSYLIQWGLALTIVAFVPALLFGILGSFQVSPRADTGTPPNVMGPLSDLLSAIPGLLKIPGGFGIVLILIGAAMATGTVFTGADAMANPAASP